MALLRQLFALVMAVAWIPMVHSCEIATALGIGLERHDEFSQAGQSPSGDCDHCAFCDTMDAGAVASSFTRVSVPGFAVLVPIRQSVLTLPEFDLAESVTAVTRSDQDYTPQWWQFSERTALPPRAPSLLA